MSKKQSAILIFAAAYSVSLLILVLSSLPVALENEAGMGGFVAAILMIGFGTWGIKFHVSHLVAD